ncbi:MAG: putative site-specific integrase-resolvase [Candidatus Pelagisphaera sp.]|jgi:predicted site-specific integrase-resolvase
MNTITTIVNISTANREKEQRLFNHKETAQLARVSVRSLLKYWKAGLIQPCNDCQRFGIFFPEETIYRIRKAETIRNALQTNIASASLVLSLNEEIHSLKQELRFFRDAR